MQYKKIATKNSVITIGEYAFTSCSSMESLTIGNSVTSIGAGAFYRCSKLTSVILPSTVETISNSAFQDCSNLTSINIPASVTNFGPNPFEGCFKLSQFSDASGSEDGKSLIRNGVLISIAPYDSTNETTLTSFTIPNGVTTIGQNAFSGCESLTSIVIPNTVTSICERSFKGCKGLVNTLTLPPSLISIGLEAFRDCIGLTKVELPNSITSIVQNPFLNCSNLEEFSGDLASEDGNCVVFNETLISYAPAGDATFTFPENVTSIGDLSFYSCANLTSIEIPNSVTSIGEYAFQNCSALTSVEIPNTVTSIGKYAFHSCGNLISVVIPSAVTLINEYTFYDCTNLASIVIPNSITSIGQYAFGNCKSLISIEIPMSVTNLGKYAFGYCIGLKSVKVYNTHPSNITIEAPFGGAYPNLCSLYVPKGSVYLYTAASKWNEFGSISPFNVNKLTDGDAYTAAEDVENTTIYYTRNFPNRAFNAIYLPYQMKYEDWAPYGDMYEVNNVHMYDTNGDGNLDKTTIEFNRVKSGNIIEHTPYVFRPNVDYAGTTITFVTNNCNLNKAVEEYAAIDCSSTKLTYAMYGTYVTRSGLKAIGAYALSPDGVFVKALTDSQTLSPFRFFILISSRTGGYNPSSQELPSSISLSIDGEIIDGDDTTDIINIATDCQQDDNYYDLMGRRVLNPAPGLYIHQGKKIYITK